MEREQRQAEDPTVSGEVFVFQGKINILLCQRKAINEKESDEEKNNKREI